MKQPLKLRSLSVLIGMLVIISYSAAQNFRAYSTAVWIESNGTGTFYNTYSSNQTVFSTQQHAINQGGGDWTSVLFQGSDFGNHYANSATLLFRGVEAKTYKTNGGNVCGTEVYYTVYPVGNRPVSPVFISSSIDWFNNCDLANYRFPDVPGHGPCNENPNYQKWQSGATGGVGNLTTNLIEDLTHRYEGKYSIELYYRVNGGNTSTECGLYSYDNNSDANYIAAFTICPLLVLTSYTNPANCGGNGSIMMQSTGIPDSYTGVFKYEDASSITHTLTGVMVSTNVATVSVPAGTYNNIRYESVVGGCVTTGFNVTIVEPSVQAGSNTLTGNQTICSGNIPAKLTGSTPVILPIGSPASFTYQWQSKTASTSFEDILGATNKDYSPSALSEITTFRRLVKILGCSDFISENTVTITVNPTPTIDNIVSNCTGGVLNSVTVNATISSGTLEYSSNGGTIWQSSNNFTGLALGTNYNFVVRGVGTTCISSVQNYIPSCSCPTVSGNSINENQTICYNTQPAQLTGLQAVTSDGSLYAYQWQSKTGTTSFVNISGAISQNYQPGILSETTTFRRLVKVPGCSDFYSNELTIIVARTNAPTILNSMQSFCSTENPTVANLAPAGLKWYASNLGGTALVPSTPVTSGVYYATQTLNGCESDTRTAVTVAVNISPSIPIGTSGTRCGSGTVTLSANVPSGVTVDWYNITTGGVPLLSGNSSYTTPNLNTTTTYYAEARNTTSGCVSAARVAVTATVNDIPANPVANIDCSGGFGKAILMVTSPIGTSYEYSLDGGAYQTTNIFNNVANGTHSITVKNNIGGCTATTSNIQVNCGCVNGPTLNLSSTSGYANDTNPITINNNTFGGAATQVTITENGAGSIAVPTVLSSPFSFTYTPADADAGKTINITLTTNNPSGNPCVEASQVFTLTVRDTPSIPDINVETNEETPIDICLPITDADTGSTFTASVCGNPSNGTITSGPVINGNQVCITYKPNKNYNGNDQICLEVCDNTNLCDQGTVTITVNPTNDNPVANNDTATTNEDMVVVIPVLNNDTDADGDALTVTTVTTPGHGTVTINTDGTVTYKPDTNFNGTDRFDYTISDGNGGTSTATVTVTIVSVDDFPDAKNDDATTNQNTIISGNVSENDIQSGDGGNVWSLETEPINGKVTFNTDGIYTYKPDNDFVGNDSFTYTLCDVDGDCSSAMVTISVEGLLIPDGFSPNEDGFNDEFVIKHSNNLNIELYVYNRWGNLIYESKSYQNDWKGTGSGGHQLPDGTYYRIAIVKHTGTNEVKKYAGYITLKR